MRRFPLMAALIGWNVAVTACWAGGRPATAEPSSCTGVTRELAGTRQALIARGAGVKSVAGKLRKIAQGNIRLVEKALSGTGLSVDALIRRGGQAGGGASGQGGPFVADHGPMHRDVARWERLSRAMAVLPLAAPLGEYEVTSGFGRRKDPINGRRAVHEGVDLRAPLRSPVAATAAGRVVFAGTKGGYGRLVEIDHGLGVRTRYGHLAAIHVHAGQQVAAGQRVGLLGSSGRSTGPHLHYEVVVDGKPSNPKRFMTVGQVLCRRN